jgi:REP element-mobilizing transposase RayT
VGWLFHVLNRGVARIQLFEKPADYQAFERVLREAVDESPRRICADALMPNHWHLLVWPETDGELAAFMQRLTVTLVRRWQQCAAHCAARESGLTSGGVAVVELVATVSGNAGGTVVSGALADRGATELGRDGESSRRRPGIGSAAPVVRTTRAPVRTARVAEGNRETALFGVGLSSGGASAKSRNRSCRHSSLEKLPPVKTA